VIGRIACWIECLSVDALGWCVDSAGEVTSNVDRKKGEALGDDKDLRGKERDLLIDFGEACVSIVDSTC